MNLKLIGLIFYLILFVNYINCNCDLLRQSLLFYKAQRAGRLPDNDIPWRGNSVLNDGISGAALDSNGDGLLSKGYFDAGDGVKFNFPMFYSMTMLSWIYIEHQSKIDNCGLTTLYKDVIKWGVDFIIASHISDNELVAQVGSGWTDHSRWEPPENINYARPVLIINKDKPGTDLAMEAVAALSAASIVFKSSDPTYSTTCLDHANKLYTFATTSNQGLYSDSYPGEINDFYRSYSFGDELAWGNIWLYKATLTSTYLDKAKSLYTSNNLQYQNEFSWENKAVGVGLLLYIHTNDQQYKTFTETALNYWLPGGGISYTPNGLAWLREWSPARYSLTMSFLASLYTLKGGDAKYSTFARNQLNYCVGNNTKQQSFVSNWGPNYPKNPHHRAAHHSPNLSIDNPVNNLYTIPGALVGGPDNQDNFVDVRTNFKTSEVALDYNVGLVGTVASFTSGTLSSTTASTTPSTSSTTVSSTSSTTVSSTTSTTTKPTTSSTTSSGTTSTTSTTSSGTTSSGTTSTTSSGTTTTTSTSVTTPKPSTTLGKDDDDDDLIDGSITNFITGYNLILTILLSLILIILN